ncbi:hypothetical protein V6X06_01670 [Klebsiella pneumoniae]|jgi:hypothetical protein
MTKSTITREESIQAVFDLKVGYTLGLADIEILKRVARMALVAMDSEPVAIIDQANLDYLRSGADADVWPPEREEMGDVLLYRHPQPAQVVPEEATPDSIEILASVRCRDHVVYQWDEDQRNAAADSWNACRAAMLHAGNSPAQSDCCPAQNCIHSAQGVDRPVAWHHSAKSKEGNHGTCCFSYASSHDFGPRYEKPQSQPHYLPERLDYDRALHFLSTEPRKVTPETVIGGNSPVIPEGSASMLRRWLAFGCGMQNAGSQLPRNLIAETESMLAAATQPQNAPQNITEIIPGWIPVSEQNPDCWCLTCRPVTLNDMRFVVCPDCGNKRCPRANDHRNACTGSNEPGQEGSAYPDTLQEPKP